MRTLPFFTGVLCVAASAVPAAAQSTSEKPGGEPAEKAAAACQGAKVLKVGEGGEIVLELAGGQEGLHLEPTGEGQPQILKVESGGVLRVRGEHGILLPGRDESDVLVLSGPGKADQDEETLGQLSALGYLAAGGGADERGYLGIRMEPGEDGLAVVEAMPGSPAAQAGIEAGDRILSVDGKPTNANALGELEKLRAGQRVVVRIERGGWSKDVEVELAPLSALQPAEGVVRPAPPAPPEELAEELEVEELEELGEIEEEAVHDDAFGLFRRRGGEPDEAVQQDEDDDEDDEGHSMERTFTFPGGQGHVRIHVEGVEGLEDVLKNIELEGLEDLKSLRLELPEEIRARIGEGGEGDVELRFEVEVEVEGDGSPRAFTWRGAAGEDDDETRQDVRIRRSPNVEFEGMATRIREAIEDPSRSRVRFARPAVEGEAAELRRELDELRKEVAELRKLREELRVLQQLREDLEAMMRRLER